MIVRVEVKKGQLKRHLEMKSAGAVNQLDVGNKYGKEVQCEPGAGKWETEPDNGATSQEQKRPESEDGKGSSLVVLK